MPLSKIKRGKIWFVKGRNSLGVEIPRHSTKIKKSDVAHEYMTFIETTLTVWKDLDTAVALWNASKNGTTPAKGGDVTLEDALAKYMVYVRGSNKRGDATRRKYEADIRWCMLGPLARGEHESNGTPVTTIGQLMGGEQILTKLQTRWLETVAFNTVASHRRVCFAFMNYLSKGGKLIDKNPWRDVPTLEEAEEDRRKTLPLDEDDKHENWNRIRASIVPFLKGELLMKDGRSFAAVHPTNPFVQYPENLLAYLEVMYETGMRRSDAVKCDPAKIERKPNDEGLHEYAHKQKKGKKTVTAFLEPPLVEKLWKLPTLDWQRLPFFKEGCATDVGYVTWYIAETLTHLGDVLGIPDIRCHRFRDSFAVNFLNGGGSLENLKELLGHRDISVTQRYYNPWVKSRTKALSRGVKAARQQLATINVPDAA